MKARGIKPSLLSCDRLGSLSRDHQFLYERLPCIADRHGVFEWRALKIRAQLFPYAIDIVLADLESWLEDLIQIGKLIKYEHQGETWGYIKDFHLEQRPHHTEKPTGWKLPEGYEIPKPLIYKGQDGLPLCHGDGTVKTDADKDKDKDKDSDKDKDNHQASSKAASSGEKDLSPGKEKQTAKDKSKKIPGKEGETRNDWGIKIILKDGSYFVPAQEDLEIYQSAYPKIDVPTELLKLAEQKQLHPEKRVDREQAARSIYATLNAKKNFHNQYGEN